MTDVMWMLRLHLPSSLGLSAFLAILLLLPQAAGLRDARAAHDEAVTLLKRASSLAANSTELPPLLRDAADRFDRLSKAPLKPDALLKDLQEAAKTLHTHSGEASSANANANAKRFDAAPFLALLERVNTALAANPLTDLAFQGSYSQTKVTEPAYGGHASAMGPPPDDPRAARAGAASIASPVQFESRAGLTAKSYCGGKEKTHILESGGSGIALFDYDGDGWLDIYVLSAFELSPERSRIPHRNALFKNKGGWTFEDVSAGSGLDVAAWSNGVCVADYDNDGRLDVYVTTFGTNYLFHNNGNGTFTDVAAAAGVQAGGWSTGCAFFDADGDGDLDLYVARYVSTTWEQVLSPTQPTLTWRGGPKTMVGPVGLPGESDLFFENRGDGTFKEATDAHGLTDAARAYGFGVIATDYDDDGAVDLYVGNDTNPNFLYHNRGDGRFESEGLVSGAALNAEGRAQAAMGVDSGDYDGDGRLDLVVTNFAHDTNTLYRNRDGRQFEDVTSAVGLAAPTFVRMGWGTAFFDADRDGVLDLFFANGHIYPNVDQFPALGETFLQKSQLFLNRREKDGPRFIDVSDTAGAGLQIAKSSRGLAVGDLDNDGDLDLVISNMDDAPTLLENRPRAGTGAGASPHWLAVQLDRPAPSKNRFAIGARVTIDAGGVKQVREVRSGGGYLSQNDLRAYYGLGAYAGTVDVEVKMPGGRTWRWSRQPIDRLLKLTLDDAAAAATGESGRARH